MSSSRRIPRQPDAAPERPSAPDGPEPPPGLRRELAKAGGELQSLVPAIRACQACVRGGSRRAFGAGYPRARLLLLKGAPSDEDLQRETAFASEAEALQRAFDRLGVPFWQVYGTTAVRCGTDGPGPDALRACSTHLLVEVEAVGPEVIVAFGEEGAEAVRFLDGRCGIAVPEDLPRAEMVGLRRGLSVFVTEPLPAGVTDPAAKRRLWADLRKLQTFLSGT